MITEKQKQFILNNIDILNKYKLQEIIEDLIDNMTKEYASRIISEIIDFVEDIGFGESLDYGDR